MEKPMQMQISMWIKSTTNRPANDIELSSKKTRRTLISRRRDTRQFANFASIQNNEPKMK